MSLTPSVWRTCRVLANPLRLACLQAALRCPGATVQVLAADAGITATLASAYLRHLQARGLLSASRHGRWVRYTARSAASVQHAGRILAAMRRALRTATPPYREVIRTLTGFTHSRRLAILAVIQSRGRADFDLLQRATAISRPALVRHLAKLERHGLLVATPNGWQLSRHREPLAAALLRCLPAPTRS